MSLRPPLLQLKPRSDRSVSALAVNRVSAMPVTGALVESDTLLRGGREVLIRHGDEVYRLRHTRNDKLILTK
jgi:hemin uptake protein HemP